ncbi:MAG: tungstate ABC transporter substrate-binding protein WtpA [Methanoregulaceae archaeon]|mgnify:CR=1 FL=1|jgi:tungstate transport system substrate-binding protein|nr:tungstate ABC transporter substrate-binding protein WtpA [Methanoregulaceae archaeon]NLH25883.1 tungstate ABC transporter substrate-binding protein WtpA [Methanomicrobiales archaeon]HPA08273.1 tungstate ABC transporter substrate-binding protein WtpA [Methanoregulaceae archaeon]HPS22285.1 tungstate ABC transporter substrate-binding protein WtpA [Methanoregulaceae archaeon]HQN88780.1 tungstate ABC transporter substrate-binding protein WtpA [Methanoregulaceae archaeon]
MTLKKHLSIFIILSLLVVGFAVFAGCTTSEPGAGTPTVTPTPSETGNATAVPTTVPTTPVGPKTKVLLATTTSLYDTGLLDYLKPKFEEKYNAELLITSQGTGKAIEVAKKGDCDILAVHSPAQEVAYMEDGAGLNRRCFAYNYFIIVGPPSDPAGIKGMTPEQAFTTILTKGKANTPGVMFVSRGDNSGTHSAEKAVWASAKFNYTKDVQKSGNWYIEAGRGMGETLQLASEKGAYTLTDEGTYLAYQGDLELEPLVSEGAILLNVYSVITVYNDKTTTEKIEMANNFVNFMISPETQADIDNYGKEKYGKNLFSAMNGNCSRFNCVCTGEATAIEPMTVFNAGSLNAPFAKIETVYESQFPLVDAQLFGGGSVTMIEKITKQGKKADVLASADAYLIPTLMYPTYADYYVTFAKNHMVVVYTNQSKYNDEITPDNWYEILNTPDVKYVISDPNTDPAGYRAVMSIQLAERVYGVDTIFSSLLGAHSKMTRTFADGKYTIDVTKPTPDGKLVIGKSGPDVVTILKEGKADYAIEYSSVAIQNGLPYIELPVGMDLSSQEYADSYATVKVKRISGTTTATETGTPIIYAVTVPKNARNPDLGLEYIKILVSQTGQDILTADGQEVIDPALGYGNVPAALKESGVVMA